MSHFIHVLAHPEPITSTLTDPIHLLDHDCKPLCGVDLKTMKRAWTICAWPEDAELWPDLCPTCWQEAHTPAIRPHAGLQLVKTRSHWTGTER
jgi:hypothetical protein